MKDLETELKELIVSSLLLEDVTADQISSGAPLFVEGLALDSIDALELGMALSKKYGVEIKPGDEGINAAFASVRSLAEFISEHRKTNGEDR